jgi:hypothetical protein
LGEIGIIIFFSIPLLILLDNIIIKFGRFIPDSLPIHDELLGVNLASCNQKAMRLEDCINENNS